MSSLIEKLDSYVALNKNSGVPFEGCEPTWTNARNSIRKLISNEGINIVEEQTYNKWFSAYDPSSQAYMSYVEVMIAKYKQQNISVTTLPNKGYERALILLLEHVKSIDAFGILDKTDPSLSTNVRMINGKNVNWDYLLSVKSLCAIANHNPNIVDKEVTILDLGGGWGRIGHVLCSMNPNATYIDADLPEIILIAEEYLPRTLNDRKVLTVTDHEEMSLNKETLSDKALHFIGSQQLAKLEGKCIDVCINIASMQEMNKQTIDAYFKLINKHCKMFYTSQADHKTRFNTGCDLNEWPIESSWKLVHDEKPIQYPDFFERIYEM